ncbi:MAG: hypothetical protein EAY75_05785 [Bacteroidetes bacterium]|nr:MAG: hypothetical protein EAY75_05785 [Bacteroidota bacterium]
MVLMPCSAILQVLPTPLLGQMPSEAIPKELTIPPNGGAALYNNISGFSNVAVGVQALFSNTTRSNLVAIGDSALYNNGVGATAPEHGTGNTAAGSKALLANNTGFGNTAHGAEALFNNATGSSNVAVGRRALFRNTTRSNLVAVGDSALFNNGVGATLSFHALGNTAVGSKALFANTTGHSNTSLGANALITNTDGVNNTAIGTRALEAFSGAFNNVAVGVDAMRRKTSGENNVALGTGSLANNLSGARNTAIGVDAGAGATGSGNVFSGYQAGANEAGSNKLYINNDNSDANNALVYGEFDTDKLRVNNKLGIGRLPVFYPLEIQALGTSNDLVKFFTISGAEKWHLNLLSNGSLNFVETGVADNRMVLGAGGEVGVGKVPLTSNLDYSRLQIKQKGLQSGLGIETSNSTNRWEYYVTTHAASNLVLDYNGTSKGSFDNVTGAYTANSDRRLKKDVTPQAPVLNNLAQLQAYQYHYLDNQPTDRFSNGFMAQDVQKIFPDAVVENEMKDGQTRLGINYQYFTVLAIKGLQEQQVKIDALEERLAKLEAMLKTSMEKK